MRSDVTAAICGTRVSAMNAQENADPNLAGAAAVAAVVAAKCATKAASTPATPSTPLMRATLKPRRALQSLDCNIVPPTATSLRTGSSSGLPAKPAKRLLSSGEVKTQNAVKRQRGAEDKPALGGGQAAAASRSPVRVEGDSAAPHEALESENLAWMDMLLALLEKKYGPQHALPVSLSALEEAKMLQPGADKRRASEGDAATDRTRISSTGQAGGIATAPALRTRAETSRLVLEREEKEREERRRRLLVRHAQQIQDSSMRSSTSCGCKTGCLKMYCVCFSARGFCHPNCSCDDCKNSRTHKEQRLEAIQSYLANDPRAFSFSSRQQESATTAGFLQLLPQKSNAVVQRGCRCKKSKCLKKYCECFQNSIACTAHCRCVDCSNHSDAAHRSESDVHTAANGLKQASMSAASPTAQPFHKIQVTVTKQPKRNHVRKSIRLSL